MKRITIPSILFCLTMAAGCSQDELATEHPDNGNATGKQITVTATMPDTRVDSRLAYEDGTNDEGTGKLVVKWAASGEKIGLYNATRNTLSPFAQDATSLSTDGKKTGFTGSLPDNTVDGDVLYAFYYTGLIGDVYLYNVTNLNIADITSNGALDKVKHAMYAKTTYQGGQGGESDISFSFRPLTAALKLTLEGIPSDVTINKLKLSGTDLFYETRINITQDPPSYFGGSLMGDKIIESLSLSSTNNVFYTGLLPGTLSDGMLITATASDGNEYSATLPDITIEAGNVYVAKVKLTKSGTITADEVKNALTGTSADAITIDGNLTLSYDAQVVLVADHTLTIEPGATLTIDNFGFSCTGHTLTINGGGKLVLNTMQTYVLESGNVKLENVTVEMRGGVIYNEAIEVGSDATIVVDAQTVIAPLVTKTLTVKTGGKIDINNFTDAGVSLVGIAKLCIDGGTISINGLGSTRYYSVGHAVHCTNICTLEIKNGGTLTSTISGGSVFLEGKVELPDGNIINGCKVKGASGLFKTDTFTLDTDDEVEVGVEDATNALKSGVYEWSEADNVFVWTLAK